MSAKLTEKFNQLAKKQIAKWNDAAIFLDTETDIDCESLEPEEKAKIVIAMVAYSDSKINKNNSK